MNATRLLTLSDEVRKSSSTRVQAGVTLMLVVSTSMMVGETDVGPRTGWARNCSAAAASRRDRNEARA